MSEALHSIEAGTEEIFHEFLGEAPQHLQAIESALLELSRDPASRNHIDTVLRSLHTLKGVFGFLGLQGLNDLCHRAEDALEQSQAGKRPLGMEELRWQFQALDALRAQLDAIGQGLSSGSFRLVELPTLQPAPASENAPTGAPNASPERSNESVQDRSIRIRVEKMDALLEQVGELGICHSQVAEGLRLEGGSSAQSTELARLGKITRELQETVLSLRLVPAEPLFLRAQRVAMDLSQRTGKPLLLQCLGKETELDKRMADSLAEPLLHLLRNAVDHGLEEPAARAAAGKPAEGRLILQASHVAGEFLLELSDDGRGLNAAKLAARGRALGLLAPGADEDLESVTRLIFEPGFSTAESLTDISGRGVGLDAVRNSIRALNGDIQVSSSLGQGCRFSIRLPLTMALMDGILVRVQDQRFVVPATQVQQFLDAKRSSSHQVGQGGAWIESGGRSLPVLDLGPWFHGLDGHSLDGAVAMHVSVSGSQACLLVDEVLGKQQVVVKGLEQGLGQDLRGVTGAAILGDGRIGLILDLTALLQGAAVARAN